MVAILASGCLAAPQPEWECTEGYKHHRSGVHPGAWANATHPQAARPFPPTDYHAYGIPLRGIVQDKVASQGHIYSLKYQVADGSPMMPDQDVRLNFYGGLGPTLAGRLDNERPFDESVELVRGFLDVARGPEADNRDIAERFVPAAYRAFDSPSPEPPSPARTGTSTDRESVSPLPHGGIALPDGPWRVLESLEERLENATLNEDAGYVGFADGAWLWRISVPSVSQRVWDPEVSWTLRVDTRDWVGLYIYTPNRLDWDPLANLTMAFLAKMGIGEPNVETWHSRLLVQDGPYCKPADR